MARPFVVASRSNQYHVHYVRTSADSAASNISSDASTEIALIMLIKLVCLLIGAVKVPILVCPLVDYPAIDLSGTLSPRQIKRDSQRVGRYNMLSPALRSMSHIVLVTIFDLPSRRLYRAGYWTVPS